MILGTKVNSCTECHLHEEIAVTRFATSCRNNNSRIANVLLKEVRFKG